MDNKNERRQRASVSAGGNESVLTHLVDVLSGAPLLQRLHEEILAALGRALCLREVVRPRRKAEAEHVDSEYFALRLVRQRNDVREQVANAVSVSVHWRRREEEEEEEEEEEKEEEEEEGGKEEGGKEEEIMIQLES